MRRIGNYITQSVYSVSGPFHPFGGAVDIVVVQQQDGTFKSSPWYVRFGKFQGVLKSREKIVDINVNGVDADFHMHLDHKGEAFFLREIDDAEEGDSLIYPSSGDDRDDNRSRDNNRHTLKSKIYNFDSEHSRNVVVSRTSSRRSQILGLMFGRKSFKGEEGGDVNRVDSLERAEIAADLLELNWSTNINSNHRPPRNDTRKIVKSSSDGDKVLDALQQLEVNEEASSCSYSNVELGQEKTLIRIDVAHEVECDRDHDGLDLPVECVEIDAGVEKQLSGEEAAGVSNFATPSDAVSVEDSKVVVDCSTEEAREVVNLASGGSGEVHVHDEVLHATTVLLPEGTETEVITKNADFELPVVDVSESCSQDRRTDSDVRVYDAPAFKDLSASSESQTVNASLEHCSTEKVESNFVNRPSGYSSLDDQTVDENDIKVTRRSPSASSDEQHFLFSDLDENRINDQFDGAISPESVDKEHHLSYENGTEKVNHLVYANSNLHLSSPMAIPRNEAAPEGVGHTGSLPNISSLNDNLGQHDVCYPLSQSLDSRSKSLQWEFPANGDSKCPKSDEAKENQLSHEEPGAKDNSGEFNQYCSNGSA